MLLLITSMAIKIWYFLQVTETHPDRQRDPGRTPVKQCSPTSTGQFFALYDANLMDNKSRESRRPTIPTTKCPPTPPQYLFEWKLLGPHDWLFQWSRTVRFAVATCFKLSGIVYKLAFASFLQNWTPKLSLYCIRPSIYFFTKLNSKVSQGTPKYLREFCCYYPSLQV